jgi:hypothetical protein
MDTFNDAALTPEQIKMLTLQFMGQHVTGDLKELDRNLVTKSNTLQGMVLNPSAVLNSIPSVTSAPAPAPAQPQLTIHQPQPVIQQSVPVTSASIEAVAAPITAQQPVSVDQNQLEFNFETSPLSQRIFDTLERLEKRLSSIEETLLTIADNKKKD